MFRSSGPLDPTTINTKVSPVLSAFSVKPVDYNYKPCDYVRTFGKVEDPFYVINLAKIVEQYLKWMEFLPQVKPFYAVKCNPNPAIIKLIDALGGGFDCASKAEIQLVQSLGVSGNNIIYANPCKQRSHVQYASKVNVDVTTFDNTAELAKMRRSAPHTKLLLRIITDDSKSICQLGDKFGAHIEDCPELLKQAKDHGLDVIGVSFHVGSGCRDTNAFCKAIHSAHRVFSYAKDQGFNPHVLDIGGGFPGTDDAEVSFEEIANAISPLLQKLFSDVDIIAEPGRFFAAASHSLFCNVIGKREQPNADADQPQVLYYLNDGIYQSFNCILFDHAQVSLIPTNKRTTLTETAKVFGPSCDALDCIADRVQLPRLETGDWFYIPNFGAYTVSAASNFNGFHTARMNYVYSHVKGTYGFPFDSTQL
eukprot:gb/GECH01010899.1/.p1 GENE.gb/GECH01010899.1/~~gb/GECH01010899.1/.p1  ORF type:complete len:422 (+),score=69.03 gb/GECH01010899.1/:1-1266(+)